MAKFLSNMLNITSHVDPMCGLCEEKLSDEGDDAFECDLCNKTFHLECCEARKGDIKQRKGSKCLKMFCTSCMKDNENVLPEKMNDLMQMIYKIDMSCQQKKASEQSNNQLMNEMMKMMKSMMEKLETLENRVQKVESTPIISRSDDAIPSTSSTFANVVKLGVPKSAVVVKPKNKQHSKKTMEQITTAVDKTSVNVCGTRNARDGGIVLCCNNTTDTMKVKQIVREKLGDDYEVTLPSVKNPRLRITNINIEIANDSIIEQLKQNNDLIKDDEIKLVVVIPRKFRDAITNDVIVEVKCEVYKKLLRAGVLRLPWRECKVLQHLYVKRCFKCCGFSHTAQQCRQNIQFCSKCAGAHKFDSCRSKKMCCINCKVANEKFGLNLNTEHHAWSRDCRVLSRKMQTLQDKIEYNASE